MGTVTGPNLAGLLTCLKLDSIGVDFFGPNGLVLQAIHFLEASWKMLITLAQFKCAEWLLVECRMIESASIAAEIALLQVYFDERVGSFLDPYISVNGDVRKLLGLTCRWPVDF